MVDINLVEVIMAAVSIGFMGFAASYAFRLRTKVTTALLITAISTKMFRHLAFILGFSFAITVIHLMAHMVAYIPITAMADLAIHLTLDLLLILVSISIYTTFRQAYGMLQGGMTAASIERDIKKAIDREIQ